MDESEGLYKNIVYFVRSKICRFFSQRRQMVVMKDQDFDKICSNFDQERPFDNDRSPLHQDSALVLV